MEIHHRQEGGKNQGKDKGERRYTMGIRKESPSAGGINILALRHAIYSLVVFGNF